MAVSPNVLFILSDQHNAQVLGCQGHPDVRTPALDRLAAEGVRMTNAIAQSPICTPSRVCFLSGQYCHNHGYYGLNGPRPAGLPTMLGYFRRSGYTTAAIGKIHCPEYWVEDDCDLFRETCGDCSIGGCPEYTDYLRERGVLADRDDSRLQEQASPDQAVDARCSRLAYEDTPEAWSVREATAYMAAARDAGRPFFAHVSFVRPHEIYAPSEPFWSMYDEGRLTLPANADYDLAEARKAPHLIRTAEAFRSGDWAVFEPRDFESARLRKLHGYLGCVSQVDHAVGQLVSWLDEAGLAEQTLVVYASDHGEYVCQHGIMEKAPGICSDAVTRIPMIWRWPGRLARGHVAEEIVEAVDLTVTLCGLAGLDAMETSDGKDVAHLLRGERGEVRAVGVTEFAWSKSVRKGQYRYVHYPREMFAKEYPDGFGELYDLAADPWEMTNLYFDPAHADLVRGLQHDLLDWLATTTRPVTILPYADQPNAQRHVRYRNAVNLDGKIHPDRIRETARRNVNYL